MDCLTDYQVLMRAFLMGEGRLLADLFNATGDEAVSDEECKAMVEACEAAMIRWLLQTHVEVHDGNK